MMWYYIHSITPPFFFIWLWIFVTFIIQNIQNGDNLYYFYLQLVAKDKSTF